MKLLFKQRFFSWFDSYDVYDSEGNIYYTVEGKISWGHKLHILDSNGNHIGTAKQVILTFMPKFELYVNENYIGCISKELTFFKPKYNIDCNGWHIEGNMFEWDYSIKSQNETIAVVKKEIFNLTDTYTIDVKEENALIALMVVLAIDAEKCSRN